MCYGGTAECTAIDAFRHAGENIVFASGSPFENVDLGNMSFIGLEESSISQIFLSS